MMLAELAMEAGLPKGVLNIVHGTNVWYSLLVCYLSIFNNMFSVAMYCWCW